MAYLSPPQLPISLFCLGSLENLARKSERALVQDVEDTFIFHREHLLFFPTPSIHRVLNFKVIYWNFRCLKREERITVTDRERWRRLGLAFRLIFPPYPLKEFYICSYKLGGCRGSLEKKRNSER